MGDSIERRASSGLEFRAEDGKPRSLRGLAAPYYTGDAGTQYRLWEGAVERYMPGAFDGVQASDVRALLNHDPNLLLGRTTAGTLRLTVTPRGLEYEVDLPDTQAGRDTAELAKRGDLTGSSCAWVCTDERWSKADGQEVREIHKVKLFDVSPVTYPAYESTSVSARDMESARASHDAMKQKREEEEQRAQAMFDAECKLAQMDA